MIVKEKMIFDLKCLNFFFVVKIEWNSLDLFVGIVSLCSGLRETDSSKRTFSDIYRSKESVRGERERERGTAVGWWLKTWLECINTEKEDPPPTLPTLFFVVVSRRRRRINIYFVRTCARSKSNTRRERESVRERERERVRERESREIFERFTNSTHKRLVVVVDACHRYNWVIHIYHII